MQIQRGLCVLAAVGLMACGDSGQGATVGGSETATGSTGESSESTGSTTTVDGSTSETTTATGHESGTTTGDEGSSGGESGSTTAGETGGTTGANAGPGVMIVWGGFSGSEALEDGGLYDPQTDTWDSPPGLSASPLGPRNSHSAVWTGDEMIVWGGSTGLTYWDNGAAYDPELDDWSSPQGLSAGPLLARRNHAAVWTGDKMIVWGGYLSGTGDLDDGAIYDPALDSWDVPPGLNAAPLSVRRSPAAVWTGDHMVVWAGIHYTGNGWESHDDGAIYDPDADSWSSPPGLSGDPGRPIARSTAGSAWTGETMIVWGGSGPGPLGDGGLYHVLADDWTQPAGLSQSPLADRYYPELVWTGATVIVWGGNEGALRFSDGALYDPTLDQWTSPMGLAPDAGPSERSAHTAVWAGGLEMIPD